MLRARLLVVSVALLPALARCEPSSPTPGPLLASRASRLGPCGLTVTRINVDQIGIDDGTLELVEIQASNAIGQTLGSCGLVALGSYEGSGLGECVRESSSRFVQLQGVVVPPDGFVLLTRGGITKVPASVDATTAATQGTWLENGPDYLVLEGAAGPLWAARVGGVATCSLPGDPDIEVLPADGDGAADAADAEHVLVRCEEGFRGLPIGLSALRTPVVCPPVPPPTATSASGVISGSGSASPTAPPPSASASAATVTGSVGGAAAVGAPATAPPCSVRFSKVDVAQPATTEVRDAREAVELAVLGDPPVGATLATCGVMTFSPYKAGSKTQVNACGEGAGTYGEVVIGHLPVPSPPFVLLAQRPDADSPLSVSKSAGLLSNGPDYLALRDERGLVVDAVAYPSAAAPAFYPSCAGWEGAAYLPAGEDAAKKGVQNQIAVRCPDGHWAALPEGQVTWRAPASCVPPADTAVAKDGEVAGSSSMSSSPREPVPAGADTPPTPPPATLPLRDSTCALGTGSRSGNGRASPSLLLAAFVLRDLRQRRRERRHPVVRI